MSALAAIKDIPIPQKCIGVQVSGGQACVQFTCLLADFIRLVLDDLINTLLEITWPKAKANNSGNSDQRACVIQNFSKYGVFQMWLKGPGAAHSQVNCSVFRSTGNIVTGLKTLSSGEAITEAHSTRTNRIAGFLKAGYG